MRGNEILSYVSELKVIKFKPVQFKSVRTASIDCNCKLERYKIH